MITPDRFVGQHDELFRKLTGAFCLEQLLWKYSNEALLSKKEINGIFHLVVQSLCGIITSSILRIEAPDTILQIKRSAIMCARALSDEIHEYNTTSLFDTFRRLGAHYRHSLLGDTVK
jgi:exocyst complex component 6